MQKFVFTFPEKCTKCMTCVRVCEVNANKVYEDYIEPLPDLCIACGDCVVHCPEGARRYIDETEMVMEWIRRGEKVIAILAPAYVAHFVEYSPLKIVGALKKLGFSEVHEVAVGAELTTLGVLEYMEKYPDKKFITSPCPSIVNIIKIWMPELIDYLCPVDSPMIALGVYLRRKNSEAKIVFIGPCIAKKTEIEDPNIKGIIDLVLTFEDLEKMFNERRIDVSRMKEELFDGLQPYVGASYPVSGGLLRTASFHSKKTLDHVLDTDILIIEGKERVMPFLKKYLENIKIGKEHMNPKVVDILYCEGCIDGPAIRKDLTVPEKRKIVAEYTTNRFKTKGPFGRVIPVKKLAKEIVSPKELKKIYSEVNVFRKFKLEKANYRMPSEKEIEEVLRRTNRLGNELNCGACGYPTCRDRAVAVLNGLMPEDECIQYQKEKLESLVEEIKEKNDEIKEIIMTFKEAIEDIKETTVGMVKAVDDLSRSSDAVLTASERGQDVIRNLDTVQSEVSSIAAIMKDTVGAVSEEVGKLTDIVEVIGSIAGQTNLLALNAAIESARLGEQGKAFAVLAGEIRSLANESKRSLEDIERLVGKILELFKVLEDRSAKISEVGERTSKASRTIATEFENIRTLLETVSASIEEVTASIEEVKASIDNIAEGVEKILSR